MFDFNTQIEIYQKYKLLQQTATFNFSLNFPKKVSFCLGVLCNLRISYLRYLDGNSKGTSLSLVRKY